MASLASAIHGCPFTARRIVNIIQADSPLGNSVQIAPVTHGVDLPALSRSIGTANRKTFPANEQIRAGIPRSAIAGITPVGLASNRVRQVAWKGPRHLVARALRIHGLRCQDSTCRCNRPVPRPTVSCAKYRPRETKA